MIPSGFRVRFYQAFRWPILFAIVGWVIGTLGYWRISDYKATLLDCAYMTFITVASIGYGEIIDLSASPGGRAFTMFIATVGILNVTYIAAKLTAFIVESQFDQVLRRRKMQDTIDALTGHYIICGVGRVGSNVAHELEVTGRPYVAVEDAQEAVDAFRERFPNGLVFHGDSSDDDALRRAGVERAGGAFAVTGDDGKNLLITLTVKQLNPAIRVVARCHEVRNMDKLKRVGADAIVSPDFTGGMRIASAMIRPTVVGFLDEMLRSDTSLRVEEVTVPEGAVELSLERVAPPSRDYIVLAVRTGERWEFNPAAGYLLHAGDRLLAMATPEGRRQLQQRAAA
jgi:voltage-gated potassium channel